MDPLEPWVDAAAVRRMAEQLLAPTDLSAVETTPDTGFGSDFVGFDAGRERGAGAREGLETVVPARMAPAPPEPPPLYGIVVGPPDIAVASGAEFGDPGDTPLPVNVSPVPAAPVEPAAATVPVPVGIVVAEPESAALSAPAPTPAPAAPVERRGPLLERLGRFREGLVRHTGAQGVFILDREGKPVMDDPSYGKLHFLARSLAQAYRPVQGQAGNVHVKIGANAVLEVIPVETAFGCLVLGAVLPQPLSTTLVGEIATALRQAATPKEQP